MVNYQTGYSVRRDYHTVNVKNKISKSFSVPSRCGGNTAMFELMRLHNAANLFYRVIGRQLIYLPTYTDRPTNGSGYRAIIRVSPVLKEAAGRTTIDEDTSDGIAIRFYSRFSFEKREIFCDLFLFPRLFQSGEHTPFGGDVKTFAIDTTGHPRNSRVSHPMNPRPQYFFSVLPANIGFQ